MSRWLRLRVQADRVVALLLLVPLTPVILICAWLVRRHDDGPAFIRVQRVGRWGVPLAMLKLRSMRPTGPTGLATGPPIAAGDDARITRVGAWLRRYRLDELPQLLHVVRGEMALLGPRPEAPDFVAVDDPRWDEVLQTPPGIAGVTQVLVNRWEFERLEAGSPPDVYEREILPVKLAVDKWYIGAANPVIDVCVALDTMFRRSGRRARIWERAQRAVPELGAVPD